MASQIKVDTITDSSGIAAPYFPKGINAVNMPGRNKIINGNFKINQRAYVSGTNTTTANQYTLDRWRVVTSGQNVTFTASGNGNIINAPADGIEQVIEDINIEGGTYVLNWVGDATAKVNGTTRAKGTSFTLPANTNAIVRFSSGTVSLVQLELGEIATPFEHRHIADELALCQRYFEVGEARSQGYATAGNNQMGWCSFNTRKRSIPTIQEQFTGSGSSTYGVTTISDNGFALYSSASVNGMINCSGRWTANAEL